VRLSVAGTVYDPNDPMGKMFFNILATFAEFEVDLLRMRTREGMAIARANGKLKGKPPKLSSRQRVHILKLHQAGAHDRRARGTVLHQLRHGLPRNQTSTRRPNLTRFPSQTGSPTRRPPNRLRIRRAEVRRVRLSILLRRWPIEPSLLLLRAGQDRDQHSLGRGVAPLPFGLDAADSNPMSEVTAFTNIRHYRRDPPPCATRLLTAEFGHELGPERQPDHGAKRCAAGPIAPSQSAFPCATLAPAEADRPCERRKCFVHRWVDSGGGRNTR
jgi:hypothetical protein